MSFRAYSAILIGMALIGFSVGLVVGIYLQAHTGKHYWAYLAVPLLGLGSAMATYGTFSARSHLTFNKEGLDASTKENLQSQDLG